MPKNDVEWVRLDDVTVAADRGIAPLGPEFAGFVVLEAAVRVRELGGGVVDVTTLAIGTSGHVALTAQPRPADDAASTEALRALLGGLLAVASSTTQALRKCARRRDALALSMLIRELEAALVPLNRAASRRGVARVARETLEAIEAGRLEVGANDAAPREPSASPAPVRAVAPRAPAEAARAAPEPEPAAAEDVEAQTEIAATVAPVESTPDTACVVEATGTPPSALSELAAQLEADGEGDEIEIVSQLPPIVAETPREDSTRGFALSVDLGAPRARTKDRVTELVDTFEVSMRRDDPALSRDLKAMVGIETSVPPPVARSRARDEDLLVEHEAPSDGERPSDAGAEVDERPRPRRRRAPLAAFAFGVLAASIAATAVRPSLLDGVFGPPLPPPGDLPYVSSPAAPAQVTSGAVAPTPRLPVVCEASLTVEGVPPGAEVLRRLGATPTSVAMPMHVALDLVATLDGHAARRAHVDASAVWTTDATAPRLDVSFTLEATAEAPWPAATGVVPMRASPEVARGLLRATSTPSDATLWVVVDPTAIQGVPCGAPVDLRVIQSGAPQKDLHVEWSAFTGSPPRATTKL